MKWKCWISLILSILLLSSCAVADEETTAPTQATKSHSLERYTQWIGHPAQAAQNALGGTETAEFMGLTFSLSPLTEGDLFSGVELTSQLDDPDGKVADTVWRLAQEIDKEYTTEGISHQNMHTDAEHFTSMEDEEYYYNLEKALEKRGAYVFDTAWELYREAYLTDEITAMVEQMGERVLEETKQQFRDSTIDFIWLEENISKSRKIYFI